MLTGNKGEWSELYAFFKLLSDGKLFSADENLEKTESFVEVRSIYRTDGGKKLDFKLASLEQINIIDVTKKEIILSFPRSHAKKIADHLVSDLKTMTGVSVELINIIQRLLITKVADKTLGKGDVNVHIYDPLHGIDSNQEFSIKSFLGSDPTLFNANRTTNITYKITNKDNLPISDEDLSEVNSIST